MTAGGALVAGGPVVQDGQARVIDGDTLALDTSTGEIRIRLWAIDAPELETGQPGQAARRQMKDLVTERTLSCRRMHEDRYGRTVAICRRSGDDLDVSEALLRRGWARVWGRYAYADDGDPARAAAYEAAEARARRAGRGIWRE